MGDTRVVSGVASLGGRALLPSRRGWGTITPGRNPVYEGDTSIFVTSQTCSVQTDGRQHHQASVASFSPVPIQQKRTSKCNSPSDTPVMKCAGLQMQGQAGRTWDREDRLRHPGGASLATGELRPEAVLLPFLNDE